MIWLGYCTADVTCQVSARNFRNAAINRRFTSTDSSRKVRNHSLRSPMKTIDKNSVPKHRNASKKKKNQVGGSKIKSNLNF